jgi:Tol biopolymer transport system component/polyisoprenoid-binding protein YceI
MSRRPRRLLPRSWKARVALALAAALVLAVGGAYSYLALQTKDAPPKASLPEPPPADGSPTGPETPAAATSGNVDGEWRVAGSDDGFVGYRVREILGILPAPNDAVGRTAAVMGDMRIEDGRLVSALITADMTQLQSDQAPRDETLRHQGLETDRFETASFRLAKPFDLRGATRGETLHLRPVGDLTIHGITKRVTFPVEGRWNGATFDIAGGLTFPRSRFDLEIDQQVGLRISDDATLEVQLRFTRRGATATPGPTTELPTQQGEPEPAHPPEPVASGAGRLVASVANKSRGWSLWSFSTAGQPRTRLTKTLKSTSAYGIPDWWEDFDPAVSPDGTQVAFSRGLVHERTNSPPPHLFLVAAAGGRPTQLTKGGEAELQPAWSPDGSRLAFVRGVGDELSIWTMNADGSSARRLTGDRQTPDTEPTWSPDGNSIAYVSFVRGGNDDLFIASAAGGRPTRLTRGQQYEASPAWSPDGRWIAYARDGDIWRMRPNGSGARRLTHGKARDGSPAWSPDGSRIAFVRQDETGQSFGGPTRVLVMRADGRGISRARLPGEALAPAWLSG